MSEFTFLKDKVVLVTGVSTTDERYKNIGQALAELLARNGAQVIAVSRDQEKCEKAISHLRKEELSIQSKQCDITDHPQVESLFDWVKETYGCLNYLINNAGTMAQIAQGIATQTANSLTATSAEGNHSGSYIITQNQGAITQAH